MDARAKRARPVFSDEMPTISSDEPATLVAGEIELEIRREEAQLAQGAGLELAYALTRNAQSFAHLFERLRI